MDKPRIAIVGTGPAGMACGHFLHKRFDLTIYEQNDYLGGHANTAVIDAGDETVYCDTAFVIFNNVAYPNFCRLLNELGVASTRAPMTFGFRIPCAGLEYKSYGLSYFFTEPENLLKPRFLKMVYQMWRFRRQAIEALKTGKYREHRIIDYVKERGYGDDFLNHFLIPLMAVVWSTPPETMLEYPVATLVEFLHNHGALQGLFGRAHWRTVTKGSKSYVDKITAPYKDRIHTNRRVTAIERANGGIRLTDSHGETWRFDRVVLACHADQALAMLHDPTPLEAELLGKFKYIKAHVMLHTDPAVMPAKRRNWAGWNYFIERDADSTLRSCFTYYMNLLQKVSTKRDYFVTINDFGIVDKAKILREYDYEHPTFDIAAMKAQERLHQLNDNGHTYFCGSYFKYGFHEDAFRTGVEVCRRITGEPIWA